MTNSPATLADPSGNFIVSEDCFLDSLLPECQCDPENGCPPDLLLLLPPLGLSSAAPLDYCAGRLTNAHWPAVYCNGVDTATGSVQLLNIAGRPPAVTGTVNVTVEPSANVRVVGGAGKVGVSPQLVITVPYAVTGGMGAFGEVWLFVRYTCDGKPYPVSGHYGIPCGSAA